jgi:hypothetical protein
MASILDMITGALGGSGAGSSGQQNPYVLAAQAAATPQTQANPNFVQGSQLPANVPGPSMSPTQANPAYTQLQDQEQKAFAAQQSQARSMALLNAGAAMLGARNPHGGPASFGEALGAGIPAGIQGLTQAEQRNLQQGRALLEAQNVGRQAALSQQQLQQGQYQLNDMQRFSQLLGFSTPQYATAYLGRINGQAAAQQLAPMLNDPKLSQDTKTRIAMTLPYLSSGQMTGKDAMTSIFGPAMNPTRGAAIEQQIATSKTAAAKNVAATNALNNLSNNATSKASVQDIIRVGGPEVAAAVQAQSSGKPIADANLSNAIKVAKAAKVGIGDTFEVKDASGTSHKYMNLGEYVVPYSAGIAGYEASNRTKVNNEALTASLIGGGSSDLGGIDVPNP